MDLDKNNKILQGELYALKHQLVPHIIHTSVRFVIPAICRQRSSGPISLSLFGSLPVCFCVSTHFTDIRWFFAGIRSQNCGQLVNMLTCTSGKLERNPPS